MINKSNTSISVLGFLLACDIALRLGVVAPQAAAQSAASASAERPHPIALAAAQTSGENYLLYRMWSDESIDVRLVNPLRTQAHDWPDPDKTRHPVAGLSFQEGWKLFQVGR